MQQPGVRAARVATTTPLQPALLPPCSRMFVSRVACALAEILAPTLRPPVQDAVKSLLGLGGALGFGEDGDGGGGISGSDALMAPERGEDNYKNHDHD